jgi:hypothetical protein
MSKSNIDQNHLSHFRDSAPGRAAGVIGDPIDLPAAISHLRHEFAYRLPAQLTDEDHAEVVDLLATLARLIGDE